MRLLPEFRKAAKNFGEIVNFGTVDCTIHVSLCRTVSISVYELHHKKTVCGVSNHVRHNPGCTAKEDGLRLKISDLERRGTVLSM